jgi:hypothetical protein
VSAYHWRDWWLGEPLFRHHPMRWIMWLLDEALDRIPTYEDGHWFRKGGWGCRLGLHRWWWVDEDSASPQPASPAPEREQ